MANSKVVACRVCLVTDVRMYNLRVYPMSKYFHSIMGEDAFDRVSETRYVCYECAWLMQKFYNFKEKCLRGETVLRGLLQASGMLSGWLVKKVDRTSFNLCSNLSVVNIDDNSDLLQESNQSKVEIDIKEEPNTETTFKIDNDIDESVTRADDDLNRDDADDDKSDVKSEDILYTGLNDNSLSGNDFSDEDDQPLALRKAKKTTAEDTDVNGKTEFAVEWAEFEADVTEVPKKKRTVAKKKPAAPKPVVKKAVSKSRRKNVDVDVDEPVKSKRRTVNTGGVEGDDFVLENCVDIKYLTLEEQIAEIEKRKDSANYKKSPYKCDYCYKGFIAEKTWEHHMSRHDPKAGEFECPVCRMRFSNKRNLQKHATLHEIRFICKSCSHVTLTTTQAKQHQRWHKGVVYKCQHCDETTTKWTSYLSHVRMKHRSDFICGRCGYSFVSNLGLSMHMSMMHKNKEDPDSETKPGPYCKECEVQFTSEKAWKRHLVTASKHKTKEFDDHGCRVCGESFPTLDELRIHHRQGHGETISRPKKPKPVSTEDNPWPRKCLYCDRMTENPRVFYAHFRRYHRDKEYPVKKACVCEQCGKTFKGKAFLKYHMRVHSEEKQYKCSNCPKAFFQRFSLIMHERTHSNIRPYPCSVCLKQFKMKNALDRHMRIHTGEKPYKCEVCGKAFGQSNSCKLHVRTVHLKLPDPYISRARREKRAAKHDQHQLQNFAFT